MQASSTSLFSSAMLASIMPSAITKPLHQDSQFSPSPQVLQSSRRFLYFYHWFLGSVMSRSKIPTSRQNKGSYRLAKLYPHTPLIEAFYGKMCGVPDVKSDSIFPIIPDSVNNKLISGSSVNSSRPSFPSQMVMVKMEAMLETLIAHIARDPSSTTQL